MTGLAAITAGKAAGSFVLGNWKWLLPAVAFLALGAYAGSQRINYLDCKAGRAADAAAAKQAALDALALDADNVREAVAKAGAEKEVLRQEARDREDAINRTADGVACRDSGPYRALYDGVRQRQRAGAGQAPGPK